MVEILMSGYGIDPDFEKHLAPFHKRTPQDNAAGETIVYLRDAHKGEADECWVVCAKGDPGAVPFQPLPAGCSIRGH